MSKRAEEKSIVYQLATQGPRVMGGAAILSEEDYKFWNINYDFKAGYEEAEKDLGWISVKDRLPEESGWYFTCVEQFKIPQCVGITYFDKKTDGWYNEIPMTKRILVSTIEIVDYWMPMPKLPKEEE